MDFLWWRYASPNSDETHQAKLSQTLQGVYNNVIKMINISAIMIFVLSKNGTYIMIFNSYLLLFFIFPPFSHFFTIFFLNQVRNCPITEIMAQIVFQVS